MPWLPELFAMAEDMRVLDEMLADGGLKVGSEEVEAYKYNYRYNFIIPLESIQLISKYRV